MNEEAFYQTPTFWVAAAIVLFLALVMRPLGRFIAKALDNRSALIAQELAEARGLREEAQSILAAYQKKQRESLQEAQDILSQTKEDAKHMAQQAEIDLKASLDKRIKMVEGKIAQAESKAIQEVQAHVVDIAIAAARTLIQEHLSRTTNDELIKQAAGELERKLH